MPELTNKEAYAPLDRWGDLLAERRRTPWWRPIRRIWLDTQINAIWLRLAPKINKAMRDLQERDL